MRNAAVVLGFQLYALLPAAGLQRHAVADDRPLNVVVLVADDLGQRDLGCYGSTFY